MRVPGSTRPTLVALAFLLGATNASGKEKASVKKGRSKGRGDHVEHVENRGPPSLTLEWVDLPTARAFVRVGGASKTPDARLFTFHDDRSRHFIALYAHCETALPRVAAGGGGPEALKSDSHPGELLCELDLPGPYLGTSVRGMTLRLGGKDVAADGNAVALMWSKAARTPPRIASPSFTVPGLASDGRAPLFGSHLGLGDATGLGHPNEFPPVDDPGFTLPTSPTGHPTLPTPEEAEETELEEGAGDGD